MAARTDARPQAGPNRAQAPDLVLTRVFEAPRKLVWQAWTVKEHLAEWWGPDHFTNPVCEIEPRKGGAIRIDMRASDGTMYPMTGTFTEFVPPERLVSLASPLDAKGGKLFELITTVTFADQGGKTLLTVSVQVLTKTPQADMYLAGMQEGWTQSLGRLANLLPRIPAA